METGFCPCPSCLFQEAILIIRDASGRGQAASGQGRGGLPLQASQLPDPAVYSHRDRSCGSAASAGPDARASATASLSRKTDEGWEGPKIRNQDQNAVKSQNQNLDLSSPPDPTATFQETQGPGERVKHRHAGQSARFTLGKQLGVFNTKKKKIMTETERDGDGIYKIRET